MKSRSACRWLLVGWWLLVPACRAADEDPPAMQATSQPAFTNHLINATSPYLLQHAHNPVDWYEWGQEALAKARRENKPIFLSIGYSACHWCHVMARESFENPEIAAVMNKYFVNIKVDREERPDLDEIYMQATLIINRGQGGWPMSVWLTPDLKPFFAGTYFPPTSRWGRPGFKELCERIGQLWQTDREVLLGDADRLAEAIRRSLGAAPAGARDVTLADIDRNVQVLARAFDHQYGGLLSGETNKFPPAMTLELMMRTVARAGGDEALRQTLRELIRLTLDQMARGGIYDQLAGGFHRYSTDPEWLVPHFEKMLYDQALLARIYLDAAVFFGEPRYERIARRTLDYCLADLQAPEGAFYSTRDADSAGGEGSYYVWRRDEILAALGNEDGELVCEYFGVTEQGNWRDPRQPQASKNILHVAVALPELASRHDTSVDELRRRIEAACGKLLAQRTRRPAPARDDKILVEWNGLMISALARAAAVLDEPRYLEAARRAADFVLKNQYADGRLRRAWRAGRTLETAFLNDYACLIDGLIELYEADFDPRWLRAARQLNRVLTEHYYDREHGGYFFTADDHEALIARSKDVRDAATPSGNSVQLMNLLRLALILDDDELRRMAQQTIRCLAASALDSPGSSERFCAAVEFALLGPVELAVVGSPRDPRTRALLRTIARTYLPNRVLMLRDPQADSPALDSPLLAGKTLVDGQPAVYVCRNYACRQPVTTPEELARLLSAAAQRP